MKNLESNTPNVKAHESAGHAVRSPATGSRPRLGLWVLVVLVLVGLGLVAGVIPRLRAREELRKDTQELAVSTMSIVHAAPGKASPQLTLVAEIKPYVEAPIYARANGYLKKWYVDIGTTVEPGQLLAEIDTPEVRQELATVRAELTRDQASLDLAKITADRWIELLKTSSVSEQEAAEKKSDLSLKSAIVAATEANVRRLEELQSFARVTAPFAGTITTRNIDQGDLISAGNGRELFRLAQTKTLRVFVHVPQTVAQHLAVGSVAELILPETPGHKFAAKIVRTAGEIDSASRTLLTELEVDNSKDEILAGSYAQVTFADMKQEMALVLPSAVLLFGADGMQVGVVGSDNKVEIRKIAVGRDFGRSIEVLSGVTSEDRIIINPPDALTPGITVRVAETPKPEKAQ